MTEPRPPCVLVLMGVSGSGKTTTAQLLAERLGWPFRDADSFHPPANIEKMASGVPLTDEDRWPWLEAIAAWIDECRERGASAIVTCSALKRAYRDLLIGDRPNVRLVHLVGERALIGARLAGRRGHFMPSALLESQFAALEAPGPDERPLVVPVTLGPDEVVDRIIAELGLTGSPPTGRAPRPDHPPSGAARPPPVRRRGPRSDGS